MPRMRNGSATTTPTNSSAISATTFPSFRSWLRRIGLELTCLCFIVGLPSVGMQSCIGTASLTQVASVASATKKGLESTASCRKSALTGVETILPERDAVVYLIEILSALGHVLYRTASDVCDMEILRIDWPPAIMK